MCVRDVLTKRSVPRASLVADVRSRTFGPFILTTTWSVLTVFAVFCCCVAVRVPFAQVKVELETMHARMLAKATKHRDDNIEHVSKFDDFVPALNRQKLVLGNLSCRVLYAFL